MPLRLQDYFDRFDHILRPVRRYRREIVYAIVVTAMALGYYFSTPEQQKVGGLDSPLASERVEIVTREGRVRTLDLEIAKTPVDIQVGLMYRRSMGANHGMLFLLGGQPKEISFWMKNTYIPLDMLFVGAEGVIVNIHHNAPPLSEMPIPSVKPVTGVIEINGGRAEELGIEIGDKVKHRFFTRVDQ